MCTKYIDHNDEHVMSDFFFSVDEQFLNLLIEMLNAVTKIVVIYILFDKINVCHLLT